jgi:hypothetical protein
MLRRISAFTSGVGRGFTEVGCPLALPLQERLSFETLQANLSAAFVNGPGSQVDSQIESSLRQIVEFLAIDRSRFGELSADGMGITHSYHVPGVPPRQAELTARSWPA